MCVDLESHNKELNFMGKKRMDKHNSGKIYFL